MKATQTELKAALETQDGKCAICSLAKVLVPDHDHVTGNFRGWLCTNCNVGLGHFRESAELLRIATAYMERGAVP